MACGPFYRLTFAENDILIIIDKGQSSILLLRFPLNRHRKVAKKCQLMCRSFTSGHFQQTSAIPRRAHELLYSPRNDPDPEMIPNPEMIQEYPTTVFFTVERFLAKMISERL